MCRRCRAFARTTHVDVLKTKRAGSHISEKNNNKVRSRLTSDVSHVPPTNHVRLYTPTATPAPPQVAASPRRSQTTRSPQSCESTASAKCPPSIHLAISYSSGSAPRPTGIVAVPLAPVIRPHRHWDPTRATFNLPRSETPRAHVGHDDETYTARHSARARRHRAAEYVV